MYLEYFKLNKLPFALTPNVDFYCQLNGHQQAYTTLIFSLRSGEGFIKIVGEVGSGKTLLCRKLLESLDDDFLTAYIPNPTLSPAELRMAFAREIGLMPNQLSDQHELLMLINNQLVNLNGMGKKVVLIIDEAQALSIEGLEALRLLTNLETKTHKLLQVVLFGQPELDEKINLPSLRQLKQRISFSYYLPNISREDLDVYLFHRLGTAGLNYGALFTKKARDILYSATNGIPRLINILCHKALLVAYGRGELTVDRNIMQRAIADTDSVRESYKHYFYIAVVVLVLLISSVFGLYFYKGII
jgi:MSHA biogenesis protein MshM